MPRRKQKKSPSISICILAGGLSSRMGRDKSRIRIGRRTMLGHIRQIAAHLDLPIRVLRRDAIPRCGPLGGIYTALTKTRADALLFLACDMPFVTAAFLKQILRAFRNDARIPASRATAFAPTGGEGARRADEGERRSPTVSIFSSHQNLFGLPCLIPRDSLPLIQTQIANQQLSLQSLARALKAKPLVPSRNPAHQLQNLNTPADLASALHKFTVPQG